MSTLPNVSAIYRDIVHISSGNMFTGETSPNYEPTSYTSYAPPKANQLEQKYAQKQRRHNELLKKLTNSRQQQNQIMGSRSPSYMPPPPQMPYSPFIENSYQNNYSGNSHSYTNSYHTERSPNTNFKIPKIKYRHIEDNKRSSDKSQQHIPILQTTLQRQFYEDQQNKRENRPNKQIMRDKSLSPKKQADMESFNGNRTYSYGIGRQNQNLKYEEKLESYYELCKKNISSGREDEKKQVYSEKFIRDAKQMGRKAMKLQDALKILSIQ